jgi:hypothetical protein
MSASAKLAMSSCGYTCLRHCIDPALVERGRVEAVTWGMLPPRGSGITLYEEVVNGAKVPARIENIDDTEGALGQLAKAAQGHAEAVCERKLAVFKSKINFKHPGGGEFVPHQDSPAYYPHGSWHVSVLVPLMPFTRSNGTLEIAKRVPLCPMEELVGLEYNSAPVFPGDCLIFDGLTPHKSGPNITNSPRIGLYMTFVDSAEASARRTYQQAKSKGTDGLSLGQIDFTGNLVPSALLASTACVSRNLKE